RAARGPAAQATAQRPRTPQSRPAAECRRRPAAAAECSATGATVVELVERWSSALQSFHKVSQAEGGIGFVQARRCAWTIASQMLAGGADRPAHRRAEEPVAHG